MSKTEPIRKPESRAFEARIPEERKKLKGSLENLEQRVEQSALGAKSKAILRKTLEHESIGHLSFGLFPCPPVVDRARGAKMWDADGKEYIDFHSGFSVNVLGHCHPEVNEAVKAQLDRLQQFAELPCQVRAEFAAKFLGFLPWDYPKKCQITVTGGEAVEVAMKVSRWYTGKPIIMTQYGDYHGRTAGAMALTSKASMLAYHYPVLPADSGIFRFHFAYCYRCPFGYSYPGCDIQCVKAVEYLFESKETWLNNPGAGITNVAAMIIEPFQSSAGYIIAPPEYLQGLKAICDRYGVLFVSDEVQSGMGRTGKMWAIEHSGVTPDLITAAKSLSNGLPISVCAGRREILDSWGPTAHSTTYCGYPVACAGGVKVLEIFERDKIVAGVARKGEYLAEGLRNLQASHPIVGHFDCQGLYAAIELVQDRKTKAPAGQETAFVLKSCLDEGLIFIGSGYFYNRLAFAPPFVISRDEIDHGLAILDRILARAEQKFGIKA
ncbi:MAG: GabT [Candidatus Aminicenantes bacterium]|nr:GabT [Candidatus Aminicenantes bacterium]